MPLPKLRPFTHPLLAYRMYTIQNHQPRANHSHMPFNNRIPVIACVGAISEGSVRAKNLHSPDCGISYPKSAVSLTLTQFRFTRTVRIVRVIRTPSAIETKTRGYQDGLRESDYGSPIHHRPLASVPSPAVQHPRQSTERLRRCLPAH